MLPAHVNLILLSATVPNTKEFADWVGYAVFEYGWLLRTQTNLFATYIQPNEKERYLRYQYEETASTT